MLESTPNAPQDALPRKSGALGIAAGAAFLSILVLLTGPVSFFFIFLLPFALTGFIGGLIAIFGREKRWMAAAAMALSIVSVVLPIFWFGDDPSPKVTAARTLATQSTLLSLRADIEKFIQDNGRPPTDSEGLAALLQSPLALTDTWHGPYADSNSLRDAWGQAVVYRSPGKNGRSYDLFSTGRDGTPDTRDDVTPP